MSTAQQLTSHETGVAGVGGKGERVRKQLRGAAGKKNTDRHKTVITRTDGAKLVEKIMSCVSCFFSMF